LNEEALAHWGAVAPIKKIMTNYKLKMLFLGSLSGVFKVSFILVWGIVSLGY
jgi:hypothetical protein